MKWMLGRNFFGYSQNSAKSAVKLWPYAETSGGAPLCQRTHLFPPSLSGEDPIASAGYVRRLKVLVVHPGEASMNRQTYARARRRSREAVAYSYNKYPCLSDTYCDVIYDGGVASLVEYTPSACSAGGSTTIVTGGAYIITFLMRRTLVFENISHDGSAYPDAVLNAAEGTAPPAGPKWRLHFTYDLLGIHPDHRFEPFYYLGTSMRGRAKHWDGLTPVIPTGVLPDPSPWGEMEDSDFVEGHLSGANILCLFRSYRPNFDTEVPAGVKHTLIVEADCHHVIKDDVERYRFGGIWGNVVAIV